MATNLINGNVRNYFIRFIEQLSEKKFILYWFTEIIEYPEFLGLEFETTDKNLAVGDIMESKKRSSDPTRDLYVVTEVNKVLDKTFGKCEFLCHNKHEPIFDFRDDIELRPGDIANHKSNGVIITTPAYILMNQRVLVETFGDRVPYRNEPFSNKYINTLATQMLLNDQATTDEIYLLFTNAYDLGQFGELCNKSFSAKTFRTNKELLNKKRELLGKLSPEEKQDPKKLAAIERILLDIDKEYLSDDDGQHFHHACGKKSWENHRKKLFIMSGLMPDFTEGESKYFCLENALSEGWDVENFHLYVNEIYKGAYERGKETEKGGELTKYVFRIYQDLKVVESDCHTKRGVIVELYKNPDAPENTQFLGKYEASTNKLIDSNYLKTNAGKVVQIRDPGTCESQEGLCYKCLSKSFEDLDEARLGGYALRITSAIMYIAMKSFHSDTVHLVNYDFKEHFILQAA